MMGIYQEEDLFSNYSFTIFTFPPEIIISNKREERRIESDERRMVNLLCIE
jgi:hypothetical protein